MRAVSRSTLQLPIEVEGIVYGIGGRPMLRDSGLAAADVADELGIERLTGNAVLKRHPELTPADITAVFALSKQPIEFDHLITRVLGPEPTVEDVLAAYQFLPRIIPS